MGCGVGWSGFCVLLFGFAIVLFCFILGFFICPIVILFWSEGLRWDKFVARGWTRVRTFEFSRRGRYAFWVWSALLDCRLFSAFFSCLLLVLPVWAAFVFSVLIFWGFWGVVVLFCLVAIARGGSSIKWGSRGLNAQPSVCFLRVVSALLFVFGRRFSFWSPSSVFAVFFTFLIFSSLSRFFS